VVEQALAARTSPADWGQPTAAAHDVWPEPALVRTLRNLNQLVPHEHSALLLAENADGLRLVAQHGLSADVGAVWSTPALRRACQAALSVTLDAALLADLPGLEPLAAGLAVPLRDGDTLIGVLALARAAAEPFETAAVRQVQVFADQVTLLLDSQPVHQEAAHLHHLAQQRAREFAAFSDIAATLNQSLDLDTILHDALLHTLKAVGMEAGWVLLVDEPSAVARVAATYGLSPAAIADQREIDLAGVDLSAIAHQLDQAVVVNDPARSPQLVQMVMRAQGLHAYVSIPLVAQGRLQGVINAFSYEDRTLGPDDVRLLTAIGRQVGVAIENARLYEREAHRVEQLRVISQAAQVASSSLEAEQLLWRVVHLVHNALGYDHVSIAMVEGDEVVVRAGVGERSIAALAGIRLKVGQDEAISRVAALGEPLLVLDETISHRGAAQSVAELAVPLRAQDRVIGVLDVRSRTPASLSEDDLAVLGPLANQVGMAIENARLYEGMRRQLAETTTLYRVSQAINSTLNLEDMLGRVVDECLEAMQAERGCVLLRHDSTDELHYMVGRTWRERREPIAEEDLVIHQATVDRVMANATAVMTVAVPGDPGPAPQSGRGPEGLGGRYRRAILCAPLIIKGQASGVIYIDNRLMAGQFTPERRDLLIGVAGQVAIAIENARLYAQIEELAASRERNRIAQEIHDTLTQQLSSVIMSLEASDRLLAQEDLDRSRQQLERGKDLSRTALHDLRQYMFDLRRGEVGELGLVTMMRQYVREFALQSGIQADFSVDGPEIALSEGTNRTLLRVLQEALANVRKHAQARRVTVHLAFSEKALVLNVSDDGIGFDLWEARGKALLEKRFGLVGMQERLMNLGGRLEVRSQLDEGTQITAVLPFAER